LRKSAARSCSTEARVAGFHCSVIFRKSISGLLVSGLVRLMGSATFLEVLRMLLRRSVVLRPVYGVAPATIWYTMTPTLQMSALKS
jgi:hypothetical protein